MLERRQYVRSTCTLLVRYKVAQIEGKSSAFDVSGSGLRLTIGRELTPGLLIELEIYLPGDPRPIKAQGKLVWKQKYKEERIAFIGPKREYFYGGIKFTNIDEDDRNRIISCVSAKLS